MTDRELIEKKERIIDLLFQVAFPPNFIQFFDLESDELLDEKIEVLEALKDGKQIDDIPKFYDILELQPEKGAHWD